MKLKIVTSVIRSANVNKTIYKVEDVLDTEAPLTFYGFPYQEDQLISLTRIELQQEVNLPDGGKFQPYEDISVVLKSMAAAGDVQVSDFI